MAKEKKARPPSKKKLAEMEMQALRDQVTNAQTNVAHYKGIADQAQAVLKTFVEQARFMDDELAAAHRAIRESKIDVFLDPRRDPIPVKADVHKPARKRSMEEIQRNVGYAEGRMQSAMQILERIIGSNASTDRRY